MYASKETNKVSLRITTLLTQLAYAVWGYRSGYAVIGSWRASLTQQRKQHPQPAHGVYRRDPLRRPHYTQASGGNALPLTFPFAYA